MPAGINELPTMIESSSTVYVRLRHKTATHRRIRTRASLNLKVYEYIILETSLKDTCKLAPYVTLQRSVVSIG